jgi:hypothetical protein
MPFLDYPVNPMFLLSFAKFFLGIASALFNGLVAIGPIGITVVFLIPTVLFSLDIMKGKKVDA